MINGHENIFIEKSGKLTKLAEKFESEDSLDTISSINILSSDALYLFTIARTGISLF